MNQYPETPVNIGGGDAALHTRVLTLSRRTICKSTT